MAVSWSWKYYNTNNSAWDFVVSDSNLIGFYGPDGFGSPVQVGQFQDSIHIRTSINLNTDACPPPHCRNTKYISASEISIAGGPTQTLSASVPAETDCLKITLTSDTPVAATNVRFYSFDGTTITNPPQNCNVWAGEKGDTTWTQIHGQQNALILTDHPDPAMEHIWYIFMSVSPSATGAQTQFAVRVECDLS